MAHNYESFSKQTKSRKIVLATLEAMQERKIFNFSSPVYSCVSSFFVVGVNIDGAELEKADTISSAGQFSYAPTSGTLSFRSIDDQSIEGKKVFLRLRFFFSNFTVTFASELSDGYEIEYDARISSAPSFRLELDYENTGTVLESNSSLTLMNNDGFFDDLFETLVWEGQFCNAYSWSENLAVDQIKKFYRGRVFDKKFTSETFDILIRDQATDLNELVPHSVFTKQDGRVSRSFLQSPKRKIFGQVEALRCVGVDQVDDGYPYPFSVFGDSNRNLMTGLVSGIASSSTITGVGTLFLSELAVNDEVLIVAGVFQYIYKVASISNNTSFTTTQPIVATFQGAQIRNRSVLNNVVTGVGTNFRAIFSPDDVIETVVDGVEYSYRVEQIVNNQTMLLSDEIEVNFTEISHKPNIPSRYYNRRWHIAGHKLRTITHQVVLVVNSITLELDSVDELEAGDLVLIEGQFRTITRVTGFTIQLNASVIGVTNVSVVEKQPVSSCSIFESRLVAGRDYSIQNTSNDAIVEFDELAEFNFARARGVGITFQFTNGSRFVTSTTTDRDLSSIFRTRDWIRSTDITHQVWYEILSVNELQIELRTSYQGASYLGQLRFKSPEYISDASVITVDCLGLEENGKWIKTASDSVLSMLQSVSVGDINLTSFDSASDDCQYKVSAFYPRAFGGAMPRTKDAITEINNSVFGSLYFDSDFNFKYSILNSNKPEEIDVVQDEDVEEFTVQTKNNILGRVIVEFCPNTNRATGEVLFKEVLHESDFVKQTSKIKKEERFTCLLFDQDDAQTIAERYSFIRSMSQSVVSIQGSLSLIKYGLNDTIFLDLRRIFKRYGSNGRKKLGLVSGVSKSGSQSSIIFNDLGNIFNRVPAIAPDDAPEYSEASSDDIAKFGFIVDNLTETPDPTSELDLGNNLIG